jgi:pyrophosphate--fructose-6-phosphate 1-phosphotransferase
MQSDVSVLHRCRLSYQPRLPQALSAGAIAIQTGAVGEPATSQNEIRAQFPTTYGQPQVRLVQGQGDLRSEPLKVGVVLSGGQAPGGHNVIAGLFDALKQANPENQLFGFLKGPIGVMKGRYTELTADVIDAYRNTGGFDMIMSGRDKIETEADKAACLENVRQMGLDGLVVIGGDDSNTNGAFLAEYLKSNQAGTCVIGVPKTIDGDMKNEQIEASFGFDTACKTYAELIGNLARDATSAVKYWHFIRLMGRSASHIALECALQTQPNLVLIGEEVAARSYSLQDLAGQLVDVIIQRAEAGKNYGLVLLPEGLIEFVPEFRTLISELNKIPDADMQRIGDMPTHEDRVQELMRRWLSAEAGRTYASLPSDVQAVLLERDSHGNILVSKIETEKLLIDLVSDRIRNLNYQRKKDQQALIKFSPLSHFFGYEGRCAIPSNFDADYCYTLGYAAAQLVRGGLTGYTVNVQNLVAPSDQWVAGGTPVTMMLNQELRAGEAKLVIRKALVDLDGRPFQELAARRESWKLEDAYLFPGPIQYFGPDEVCNATTKTLALEKGA